jgi:hypothetical protein
MLAEERVRVGRVNAETAGRDSTVPWPRAWPLLLPASYLVHLAEEWFGGFVAWASAVSGVRLTDASFLAINAVAWPVTLLGAAITVWRPARVAPTLVVAAALGLNGVVHVLGSILTRSYSPGAVTGVLLYLPVAGRALARGRAHLSPRAFRAAIAIGVALHGVVAILAVGAR